MVQKSYLVGPGVNNLFMMDMSLATLVQVLWASRKFGFRRKVIMRAMMKFAKIFILQDISRRLPN
jgi:hypothetical protein